MSPPSFHQNNTILFVWLLIIMIARLVTSFDLEHIIALTSKHAEEKMGHMLSECYGDYGCFSVGGKFVSINRPVNLFPYAPETIATTLLLYTRRNPNTAVELPVNEVSQVNQTNFNFSMPTKFIVHGFLETGYHSWCSRMKDEFLIYEDFNVIVVDWLIGAFPPYTQAVANARLVGAILARFIQLLEDEHGYLPEMSHIIGHSLGAHIAGYAGERLNKLGRISGLDPAGPYFENTDPVVRLDPTDAVFVDVIHTDGASLLSRAFGMQNPIGHIDFYPNGGVKQPGCEESVAEALEREDMNLYRGFRHWVACRHVRAHEYFTESINSHCLFTAYECSTYQDFLQGLCTKCNGNKEQSCARMGFHSDEYRQHQRPPSVKFYLNTNSDPPFCTNHHLITIQTSSRPSRSSSDFPVKGVLLLQIDGDKRKLELNELDYREKSLEPDMTYSVVVSSRITGPLRRVHLKLSQPHGFTNQLIRFFKGDPTLAIDMVEVQNLETREVTEFCGGNKILKYGSGITLYPRAKC